MATPVFKFPPENEPWPHAWVVVGDILISVTQEGPIGPDHWDDFIADLGSDSVNRVLGLAIGAIHLNSGQRRSAALTMMEKRVAAVVQSSVARGVATALGWMGLQLRAYDWSGLMDAFIYLGPPGVTPEECMEIVRELLAKAKAPTIEELSSW